MLFSHASPHTYKRQAYKRGSGPLKDGNGGLMPPLGIRLNGNGAMWDPPLRLSSPRKKTPPNLTMPS